LTLYGLNLSNFARKMTAALKRGKKPGASTQKSKITEPAPAGAEKENHMTQIFSTPFAKSRAAELGAAHGEEKAAKIIAAALRNSETVGEFENALVAATERARAPHWGKASQDARRLIANSANFCGDAEMESAGLIALEIARHAQLASSRAVDELTILAYAIEAGIDDYEISATHESARP
jgi:hypothetical protein